MLYLEIGAMKNVFAGTFSLFSLLLSYDRTLYIVQKIRRNDHLTFYEHFDSELFHTSVLQLCIIIVIMFSCLSVGSKSGNVSIGIMTCYQSFALAFVNFLPSQIVYGTICSMYSISFCILVGQFQPRRTLEQIVTFLAESYGTLMNLDTFRNFPESYAPFYGYLLARVMYFVLKTLIFNAYQWWGVEPGVHAIELLEGIGKICCTSFVSILAVIFLLVNVGSHFEQHVRQLIHAHNESDTLHHVYFLAYLLTFHSNSNEPEESKFPGFCNCLLYLGFEYFCYLSSVAVRRVKHLVEHTVVFNYGLIKTVVVSGGFFFNAVNPLFALRHRSPVSFAIGCGKMAQLMLEILICLATFIMNLRVFPGFTFDVYEHRFYVSSVCMAGEVCTLIYVLFQLMFYTERYGEVVMTAFFLHYVFYHKMFDFYEEYKAHHKVSFIVYEKI